MSDQSDLPFSDSEYKKRKLRNQAFHNYAIRLMIGKGWCCLFPELQMDKSHLSLGNQAMHNAKINILAVKSVP